ncbi:MAG TPA: hypothetical protein VE988_26675 [Gemmataceae bacterium]|nr:hypothetical protein [Gemmataceae bacterium]
MAVAATSTAVDRRIPGRALTMSLAALTTVAAAASALAGGDNRLPTAADVKNLAQRYQAEREALVKSGAPKRFLPNLFELAEAAAKRGDAAAKESRYLQAAEAYRQSRWQLPYQGPGFPDHVAHVFGNLRLRHGNEILALAYSPDGKYLASAGLDRTVKIWDMSNGHETVAYRGHQRDVRHVAFSPDGKWIASAGGDKDIHLWDPQTAKPLRTLKGGGAYTTALVISPDGKYVFAAGDDRTLRIYDAATGELKHTLPEFGKAAGLRWLAFNADGTRLAAGAEDGRLRLWVYPDVFTLKSPEYWSLQEEQGSSNFVAFSPNGKLLVRCGPDALKIYDVQQPTFPGIVAAARYFLKPPDDPKHKAKINHFTCAAFSKDGKTLFVGCSDGLIYLIDPDTAQLTGTFKGHNGDITALVLNAQGTQLASASTDYTVRTWDFDIVLQSTPFEGHTEPIWAADFSPDGQRLVSCGADRTLRTWDVLTGAVVKNYGEHAAGLTAVRFSPDGKTILVGGGDKLLRLFDVDSGKVVQTFQGHAGTVTSAMFNSDGSKIVSGGADKSVIIWSTATAKPLATIDAGSLVMAVAFTPDGKQVVAGTADRRITFYGTDSGKPGPTWVAHGAAVSGLSFDAKGQYLASCGFDNFVKVWKVSPPGTLVVALGGHSGPLSTVAFRPDGNYLVSAGSDHLIRLWKKENGSFKESRIFKGHTDWVTALAFNRQGFLIASAGADRTIKVWELASRELPLISEHTGSVECVAVSPDGKFMASGGTDKTIKIWDLKTGVEIRTITGHGEPVVAIAFSPDGNTLLTSGGDRNLRRWKVADGQELPPLPNQQNITNFINAIPQLAFRPDAKRFIAWVPFDERGTRVATFDPATGDELVVINDRGKHNLAVAWLPDFKLVALGAKDGNLRIYSINQDKLDKNVVDVQLVKGIAITSLAYAPDAAYLIAGCDNGQVLILDPAKGTQRQTLAAHGLRVSAIAVSPDSKRFATVGVDNVVKLWDASGKELRKWTMPAVSGQRGGLVTQLTFTPDGRFLLTANANTTLFMLESP